MEGLEAHQEAPARRAAGQTMTRKRTMPACDICSERFASLAALLAHYDAAHPGHGCCRLCSRRTRTLAGLNLHEQSVHGGGHAPTRGPWRMPPDGLERFIDAIDAAVARAGMSWSDVRTESRGTISFQNIDSWMRGAGTPSATSLLRIADALGVPPGELLRDLKEES